MPSPQQIEDPANYAIPSVDGVGTAVSPTWEVLDGQHSRRVVLKGALLALGTFVIDAVVGLPFVRGRRADAASYTVWNDCKGWFNTSTICYPPSAYYGTDNRGYSVSWRPGTYWHRSGFVAPTGRSYTHDPSSCSGHNAWIWAKNSRSYNSNWMCSDGYVRSYTGWASFSICRSAWA